MNQNELKMYNLAQIKEIYTYKWIESEKNGFDIGEERAATEWIRRFSKDFRKNYLP